MQVPMLYDVVMPEVVRLIISSADADRLSALQRFGIPNKQDALDYLASMPEEIGTLFDVMEDIAF